jgi:DNA repair exonuclease SbcCD ATPase subunit
MADEPTTPVADGEETTTPTTEPEDQRVPYERFQQANKKAKEASDQAKQLQKQMDALRDQLSEREQAGLPELDQMKKRLEAAEKRAEQAEAKAGEFEQQVTNSRRERWITAAASSQNFIDPDDASRFVDLTDIESAEDAERAVKRIAKAKKHLVKPDEPVIPGRVLQNGNRPEPNKPGSNIDLTEEAQALSQALQQFASRE